MKLFPYIQSEILTIQEIPWNVIQANAPSFWTVTKGSGVVIAVVDTGIDQNHFEFTGKIIGARSFVGNSIYNVIDHSGHGTHTAGTAGGKTVGFAPECRIMPIKVFEPKTGYEFQDAFQYILTYNKTASEDDKVRVVSCSWGGGYDSILHFLIRQLIDSGVIVVCAAGNAGDGNAETSEIWNYPGFLWEPITVAAINQDNNIASYSSSYDGIDIASYGTSVYSAWPSNLGGGYKLLSGTSMATPAISGACALIIAAWKKRTGTYPTVEQVENVLFKHIKKVNLAKEFVGHGLLDLTWKNTNWPLHRVQVGGFYFQSGQEKCENDIKDYVKSLGYGTFKVTY